MALTNAQLWNYIRDKYPNFKSQTAKGTADLFTARGFEQLSQFDSSILNDFFSLSLRVFLQKIDVADVKDLLAEQDFGESYDTPYGGYVQRISINSVKPISPGYKGLHDGDSPDPFVVRKPETNERFFTQNFDYASLITTPDTALYKNMFVAEDGMSRYLGGIMKALQNGYTLQKYTNKLEALNAGINSVTFPLKDTQKYETAAITDSASIIAFVKLVRDIVDAMVFNPATSAFNAYGFESTQEKSRLRLLVKPQLMNALATISRLNSPEDLSLPIEIVKVPNFGGLTPVLEAGDVYTAGTIKTDSSATPTFTTYKAATINTSDTTIGSVTVTNTVPIYDDLGVKVATAFVTSGTTYYIPNEVTKYDDPNEDVLAVIADKGYIFENTQNPYQVEPIRNPRGLYTNFWASSPNNGIVVDHLYNVVTISEASS
jgi:hypothetical protein